MSLRFAVILLTLAFSLSVSADSGIKISGRIRFFDPDFKVVAYQRHGNQKDILASSPVNSEGYYNLNIKPYASGVVTLNCADWQSVNVWLEDENLEVDFRGKDTARIKIKNPPFVYIRGGAKNELMNWINFESYRNYGAVEI